MLMYYTQVRSAIIVPLWVCPASLSSTISVSFVINSILDEYIRMCQARACGCQTSYEILHVREQKNR